MLQKNVQQNNFNQPHMKTIDEIAIFFGRKDVHKENTSYTFNFEDDGDW